MEYPGQAYGCRCYAEAVQPVNPTILDFEAVAVEQERLTRVDPPINSIPLELAFIGIGRAAWVGARAAIQGIRSVTAKVGEQLARHQTERLFRRPEGVPKEWIKRAVNKGEGVVFEKPNTNGTTFIKIQRAKPASSQSGQRFDNIRWTRDGKSLDINGNIVPKKSLEAHIPIKDFRFRLELFK